MADTHPLADGETRISPWMPEQDPLRLAAIGKMGEEASELSARAFRCVIQGLDETDPDTGRTNREELSREMSDVEATMQAVHDALGIHLSVQRIHNKKTGFRRWFAMITGSTE